MSQVAQVLARYKNLSSRVSEAVGHKKSLDERYSQLKDTLTKEEVISTSLDQQAEVIRVVSSTVKTRATEDFARLVSEGIRFIFETDDEFRVVLKDTKTLPEASFELVVDGEAMDPKESLGGGTVDVISFCLRLVMLELFKVGGSLILDESFKHLSRGYLSRTAMFLRQYAETSGRQIILVTHSPEMTQFAHRVFRVTKHNDTSRVEEVDG